jgi:hypothetical protein
MAKAYKEQLADFKVDKKNKEEIRAKPKAKKPKKYKIVATFNLPHFSTRLVVLGNYAKKTDAEKAVIAFSRHSFYTDIKIEELYESPPVRTN